MNSFNESENGKVPGYSRSLKLRYSLKSQLENADKLVKLWEIEFLKNMKNLMFHSNKASGSSNLSFNINNECSDDNKSILKIVYATSQSLDLEIDSNAKLDTNLISGTFMLTIIFASILMSFNTNWITSPGFLLPFSGIMSAIFGLTSGFGFLAMIGYKGCSLIFVIPYLVLGIGIDDMFIIYSSFTYAFKHKSNEQKTDKFVSELIKETLRKSGVSITITSLTDFVAFIVGITTGFKSVQIFCVYAAFSIAFCFFYQCCLFSSVLCLHAKRIESKKNTFLFWAKQSDLNCIGICKTNEDSLSKNGDLPNQENNELVLLNGNTIQKEIVVAEKSKKIKNTNKINRATIFLKKIFKFLICNKIGNFFLIVKTVF